MLHDFLEGDLVNIGSVTMEEPRDEGRNCNFFHIESFVTKTVNEVIFMNETEV